MPITQKAQQVQALAQSFIDAANEYQDHDNTVILMAAIGKNASDGSKLLPALPTEDGKEVVEVAYNEARRRG